MRGHQATRVAPGSFRCLVCQAYVRGTDAGHCPRCGFVPPSAPPARNPDETLWIGWPVVILVALGVLAVLVR